MNQTVNKVVNQVAQFLPTHELNARRRRKRTLTQGKSSSASPKVSHPDPRRAKVQT